MARFEPQNTHFREALLLAYNLKSATDARQMLDEAYGEA